MIQERILSAGSLPELVNFIKKFRIRSFLGEWFLVLPVSEKSPQGQFSLMIDLGSENLRLVCSFQTFPVAASNIQVPRSDASI